MTVDATTVTVGTTPTQISHASGTSPPGLTVAIHVPSDDRSFYFGGPNVDTGTHGYPVQPGGDLVPSLDPNESCGLSLLRARSLCPVSGRASMGGVKVGRFIPVP